jgi:putative nucleotidyltransferase with HDIG domain
MEPKARIIVIDDEEGMRDWLSFELGQQGYSVVTAENGVEGIEKCKEGKFDIAVIDIKMPGMDGITALDIIKKIDPDIEAIIATGFGTMETSVASMRKGASDYISKPFNVEEITIVIEKAIEKRQMKETVALFEIGKAIFSTVELDQLLKLIIELTVKVLRSDDASIMLFDHEKKLYIAASHFGLSTEIMENTRLAIGERIAGRVARDKQPLLLNDALEQDSRFKDIEGPRKSIKSSMVLPLIGKTSVLGILNICRMNITDHFGENDLRKAEIFASQIALAVENAYLFKELNSLYMSIIRSLANAIDAKDHYTNRHSENVAGFAAAIAKEMGLNSSDIEKILQASQIHDLGKIGVHDFILNKTEKLSAEEWNEIMTHPLKGAQILEPLGFINDIVEVVKQHHENYDGSGYPHGLKGEEIRLAARIIAAADAYDAMTSDRPYRKALTKEQAITELNKFSNIQFDPGVISAFIKVLEKD